MENKELLEEITIRLETLKGLHYDDIAKEVIEGCEQAFLRRVIDIIKSRPTWSGLEGAEDDNFLLKDSLVKALIDEFEQ